MAVIPRVSARGLGLLAATFLLPLAVAQGQALGRGQSQAERRDAVPVWPAPPATARIAYLRAFSLPEDLGVDKAGPLRIIGEFLFGKESRTLDLPFAIAVSASGDRIYVSDTGLGAVHCYDIAKSSYALLRPSAETGFASPVGLALAEDGRLFVADSAAGEVRAFDAKQKPLFVIGKAAGLERPTGLALRGSTLYVADSLRHIVLAYELGPTSARELFRIGGRGTGPGQFNYPVDLAIGTDGSLYVNDSMNFRVQRFDAKGAFLSSFGSSGGASGQFQRSKGLGLDSEGQLYVVDALADTVQAFDDEGHFLINFGVSGSGPGEFWLPAGLAIDRQDRVYVVDSYNKRVQIFQYLKKGGVQ